MNTPPGSLEAEQPLADQQVRRRRHRQELGEPLQDAEEGRFAGEHGSVQLKSQLKSTDVQQLKLSLRSARLPLRLRLALRLLRRRRAGAAGACAAARVGAVAAPEADDRRGDEHARVGAGDDADDHREREAVQHLAAEEEQRQRGQQRRARRDDRPAQRLVDRRR